MTIPEFARKEGLERLAALPKPPDHKEHWNAEVERMPAPAPGTRSSVAFHLANPSRSSRSR